MNKKTVYQTDHLGVFTGTAEAERSPLEVDVWHVPGGCVELPPPTPGEFQVPRWDGQHWQLISSYKGLTAYNTKTSESLVIDRAGQLPAGYTLSPPGPGQVWRNGGWVDDIPATLKRRHAEQYQVVNASCEATLVGGFWSQAIGSPHRYGSQLTDQLNLLSAVLSGSGLPFPCIDEQGLKAFRDHTIQQLRQVFDDYTRFNFENIQLANTLKQRLDQALADGDLSVIEAIRWEVVQP